MNGRRHLLVVVVLGSLLAYLGVLGVRPLVTPDEFRYAEIPREMLASGDWTVPTLNGFVYFEKPPLGYWATAASMFVFGENAFAARFPFALATLLTALIAYGVTRRYVAGDAAALLVAGVFLSSAFVAGVGTIALLDPLLTLFLTSMLAAFFVATEHPSGWNRQKWLALCGAAAGAAFLTKGFLIFAVGGVVAVPYLLWSRRWKEVLTLAWTPLLAAVLVAMPWSIMIAVRDPDFWPYFFWVEHWNRFAGGETAQHSEPWWFYVPVLLLGGVPWTFLLPVVIFDERRAAPGQPAPVRDLLGSAPFSSSRWPPASCRRTCCRPSCRCRSTSAAGWRRCAAKRPSRTARRLGLGFAVVMVLIGIGILLVPKVERLSLGDVYVAGETYKSWAGALAFLVAAAAAIVGARCRTTLTSVAGVVAGMFIVFGSVPFLFPSRHGYKTPGSWIREVAGSVEEDTIVVSEGRIAQAVSWCLRRDDVVLAKRAGEMGYGVKRQPERLISLSELEEMSRDPLRTQPVLVIVLTDLLEDVPGLEPDAALEWRGMTMLRFD